MRRDQPRPTARARIYGPGPTPGSRVLLARPGQPMPEGYDETGAASIDAAPVVAPEPTEGFATGGIIPGPPATPITYEVPESFKDLEAWVFEATGDERRQRALAAREAEEARPITKRRRSVYQLADAATAGD